MTGDGAQPQRPSYYLVEADAQQVAALQAAGHHPVVARMLASRGFGDVASAKLFLAPPLRDLPDPHLLVDAEAGAQLLADAVAAKKNICIYGDYDVDGISASALLHDALVMAGARPTVFLPDRLRDGYGLRLERLHELADAGAQVFVSCDCGSTAVAEVAAMKARGCQFVICDHHTLTDKLPPADAHLNPKRPESRYPDRNLCAAGVAMVLATALRRACANRGICRPEALELRSLLELAALGTVADMVELRDVNRTLAWHGLRALGTTQRPGLRALIGSDAKATDESWRVGFQVGPRINAAGRIAEPQTALRMLIERDVEAAQALAAQLDVDNHQRRDRQKIMQEEATGLAAPQKGAGAVVVAARGWHPGVVGLVAQRLMDEFHKPAFAIAIDDNGLARGSGRSVGGYDLVAALHSVGDGVLQRFGGHAFAAGVTLHERDVAEFARRIAAHAAEQLGAMPKARTYKVDAEVRPEDCTLELIDLVRQLEPFGQGNEAPRFVLKGVQVRGLRAVGGGQWVQARLHTVGRQADYGRGSVAAFGSQRQWQGIGNDDLVDVVCRLQRHTYREQVSAQASVDAVLPVG